MLAFAHARRRCTRAFMVSAGFGGALALKIDLAIEHELGTLAGGAACLAAIRTDARRLAAAYPGL